MKRHVAHVDVLLLDVLDRLGAGVFVDIEHDQAQGHLQRRGKVMSRWRHSSTSYFGCFELVAHELQHRGAGKIGNRKHRLEHRLQSFSSKRPFRLVDLQELVVRRLLNLDEVGHRGDFADGSEDLADPLATVERLRHCRSSFRSDTALRKADPGQPRLGGM
jgi:hypothetical protein